MLALVLAFLMGFTILFSTLFSVLAQAAEPAADVPEVAAEAYLVMDAATGQVLVEKNSDQAHFPASITKIMTLALTLETLDIDSLWDSLVPVSQAAVDALIPRATMVSLVPGEEARLLDLLYATQVESANDAANVLAEYVAGSMDDFANKMNLKARGLGLSGSFFKNPSGQPDQSHVTTAYDMAAITRWALTVPHFREIFAATEHRMAPTNKQPAGRSFHSSNLMLQPYSYYYVEGTTGSKSGYIDDARFTLVTTAQRGDTELICVVLKCPTNDAKYSATQALLEHCFATFHRERFQTAAMASVRVPVYGGGADPLGDITVHGDGQLDFMLHNSLDASAVEVAFIVPERYLIGEAFEPMAVVSLKGGGAMPDTVLAKVPLVWSGLEEVLANNTGAARQLLGQEQTPPDYGRAVAIGIPLLIVLCILSRIIFVQWRRARRRKARLAAMRAQQPVSIAERPRMAPRALADEGPASSPRRVGAGAQSLRVVTGSAAPRRVGAARRAPAVQAAGLRNGIR